MNRMTFLLEEISKEIVWRLMEERGMEMGQALHVLYTSATYRQLGNPATGLCTQSTAYVYEFLEHELETGRIA